MAMLNIKHRLHKRFQFSRQANFHKRGQNKTPQHIQLGGVLFWQRKPT